MPVYHSEAGAVETLEWGEGDEVFVLAHAAAAGPGSLTGLARLLERTGRRIVAPFLNGYGGTSMREARGVEAHVAVLKVVFSVVPARRRVLFGHSMGGLAALLAGGWADRLVVFEPIVTGCLRADNAEDRAGLAWDRAINAAFDAAFAAGQPERAVATFVEAWNGGTWEDLPEGARARLVASAASLGRDMRDVSFFEMGEIQAPREVLVLQGEDSPPVTGRMTARLVEWIPGARRVVLAGCGHMGPVRNPEAVAGWFSEG